MLTNEMIFDELNLFVHHPACQIVPKKMPFKIFSYLAFSFIKFIIKFRLLFLLHLKVVIIFSKQNIYHKSCDYFLKIIFLSQVLWHFFSMKKLPAAQISPDIPEC
jgi:hypothetical protein